MNGVVEAKAAELLAAAENAYRAGEYSASAEFCGRILYYFPGHPGALFLLGYSLIGLNSRKEAIRVFRLLAGICPQEDEFHAALCRVLIACADLAGALGAAAAALRVHPDSHVLRTLAAETYNNLGVGFAHREDNAQAAYYYLKALEIRPTFDCVLSNMCVAMRMLGEVNSAILFGKRAIAACYDNTGAYLNLAQAYKKAGWEDKSEEVYISGLTLNPADPDLLMQFSSAGIALLDRRHNLLRATEADPRPHEAYFQLGNDLMGEGEYIKAIELYGRSLAVKPDKSETYVNRAICRLLIGELRSGFKDFEWRRHCPQWPSPLPEFPRKLWKGEYIEGRRILLHNEQGFGDTIHFSRYVPMVAKLGAKVIFNVQPELYRLYRDFPGVELLVSSGEPIPDFEYYAPLLSLPVIFGTDIATIPANVPYLFAEKELTAFFAEKLAGNKGLKVGICARGNPKYQGDMERSPGMEAFAPLFKVQGAAFFGIQKTPERNPGSMDNHPVKDMSEFLVDFAHTAALMANMDLIVTSDTSVVHLAGALGRPTWTALTRIPDWRWMLRGKDCPWYPTMRLFRQRVNGDWSSVVSEMAAELAVVVDANASRFA